MPAPPECQWRTQYGGTLGAFETVCSFTDAPLECFRCGDDSLYHDAWAYWDEPNDDLLCETCFACSDPSNKLDYRRVLTQH